MVLLTVPIVLERKYGETGSLEEDPMERPTEVVLQTPEIDIRCLLVEAPIPWSVLLIVKTSPSIFYGSDAFRNGSWLLQRIFILNGKFPLR